MINAKYDVFGHFLLVLNGILECSIRDRNHAKIDLKNIRNAFVYWHLIININ